MAQEFTDTVLFHPGRRSICLSFHESWRQGWYRKYLSVHKCAFTHLDLAVASSGGLIACDVEMMALGPRRGTSWASDKPSNGLPDSPCWSIHLLEGSQQLLSTACVTAGQTCLTCQCLGRESTTGFSSSMIHPRHCKFLSFHYLCGFGTKLEDPSLQDLVMPEVLIQQKQAVALSTDLSTCCCLF